MNGFGGWLEWAGGGEAARDGGKGRQENIVKLVPTTEKPKAAS
jgi:hypothetical protein